MGHLALTFSRKLRNRYKTTLYLGLKLAIYLGNITVNIQTIYSIISLIYNPVINALYSVSYTNYITNSSIDAPSEALK